MAMSFISRLYGKSALKIPFSIKTLKPAIQPLGTISRCISSGDRDSSFKYGDLNVQLTRHQQPRPNYDKLIFGTHFSDHMFEVGWSRSNGWEEPRIVPLHNLSLHPAASSLHYAIELFEGMKAFRGVDGKVRMFRPNHNMERMIRSAKRTGLPTFDGEELLRCIAKLLCIDRDWVPRSLTSSMYIRPTLISTEPTIGVHPPNHALLFVLAGPVGPYFPSGGFVPVTLLADEVNVRAWKGGVGQYKLGCNYAPGIVPQIEAQKKGCQQILWLYGDDYKVTEAGTMNCFMFWENKQGEMELITPGLDGTILPGVTRISILELVRDWGEFKVTERAFTMDELLEGLKENRVKEVFGAGTACVVCPVGQILFKDVMYEIPTMKEGAPLASRLLKTLNDIQYGQVKSPWAVDIEDLAEEEEGIRHKA